MHPQSNDPQQRLKPDGALQKNGLTHRVEQLECPVIDDSEILSPSQERRVWRKIDLRLLPMISLMQLLSFMDRGNIGNAKLDGLMTQLNLTGNKYNIALTVFFISFGIFEFPSNLIIQVIRPSRWLPGIMVLWGVVMTLMGFVKSYPQLVAVRFCLGVAEAGFVPGVVYYLTMWYPKYMCQYRIALFSGTATLAGAFSGLLAFAISFMNGDGSLQGWSWIFILEGIMTVVVGLIGILVMVDYPATAQFLTSQERTFVIQRHEDNTSDDENDHAKQQVWAAFADWQVWALSFISMTIMVPLYGITYFLPTIINNFGYNTSTSQLLTVPPYACAFITLLIFAHFSDKHKIRSPFIFALQLIALIGYIINISNTSSGVKYFGTYLCVIGSYSAPPGSMSWLANNLQGKYKRAVGLAVQITMGNLGGAIACNIFRTQDAPHYTLGYALEIMFLGMGLIAVPITALCYRLINLQRHREKSEKGDQTEGKSGFLGDKVSTFEYTL